jgi:hypothetical protein
MLYFGQHACESRMMTDEPAVLARILWTDPVSNEARVFFLIKATNAAITPSYRSYQFRGLFDAARSVQTTLGASLNIGSAWLITTSDATITSTAVSEATGRRVILCHSVVSEHRGATPRTSRLSISTTALLNPDVNIFPATNPVCPVPTQAVGLVANVVVELPVDDPDIAEIDYRE